MLERFSKTLVALAFASGFASPALGQVSVPAGGSISLPAGSLNQGCADLNIQGIVGVGAGQIAQGATIDIGASGVLDGGQGTINVGAGWLNAGSFIPGTSTVIFTDACASGPFQFGGNTTFNNLTLSSTTGRTFVIPAGTQLTVNGVLTLQGIPGTPVQLISSAGGTTAYILLGPGAQVVTSNAVIGPDVQIGAQSPREIPILGGTGLLLLTLLLLAASAQRMLKHRTPVRIGAHQISNMDSRYE